MLKIKAITFNKTIRDESISHQVFSTASVYFTNAEPIHGAYLYWKINTTDSEYTTDGDYKFYYDMAGQQFFAAVKFPKDVQLSSEERQELAFILLEERGSLGSYTIETSKVALEKLQLKRSLADFTFPEHFQENDFKNPYRFQFEDKPELARWYKNYDEVFINSYLQWRKQAVQFHPNDLTAYSPFISFSYMCYANPHLSELYLIKHLHKIDWTALQSNLAALSRLSSPFKQYMLDRLAKDNVPLEGAIKQDPSGFVERDTFFEGEGFLRVPSDYEMPTEVEYSYFEYERGPFQWQGAEHLIKEIPSLAGQLYDPYGYKKPTNKEMDAIVGAFTATQVRLFSAMADLHWLHRYRELVDWPIASSHNPNLTEAFLLQLEPYISFKHLAKNMHCHVSEHYLIDKMPKFKHIHPAPLILRHLTKRIFELFPKELELTLDILYDYYDYIDKNEFDSIFDLLSK